MAGKGMKGKFTHPNVFAKIDIMKTLKIWPTNFLSPLTYPYFQFIYEAYITCYTVLHVFPYLWMQIHP